MARRSGNKAQVKVGGFRELAAGSEDLFQRIIDAIVPRFMGVAEDVAGQTQTAVPVVTGALAASLTAKPVKRKTAKGAKTAMGKASVPYAGWIEFGGTRGREYVPEGRYLFPAAMEARDRVAQEADDAASDEIERMTWPTPKPI